MKYWTKFRTHSFPAFLNRKIKLMQKNPNNTSLALYGVWIGMYLDWVFRGAMFFARFKGGKWLEKKVI